MSGKQDWSKVSREVKDKKIRNKKSKRDMEREDKIAELGGESIPVYYGYPLPDSRREERMNLLFDLMYPERHVKKPKNKPVPDYEKYHGKVKTAERHAERERKIKELGGTPIEIYPGRPLSRKESTKRSQYLHALKYPGKYYTVVETRTKEDFINYNLRKIKERAKKAGVPFNLTFEDYEIPEFCPVLGIRLNWNDDNKASTPSVDRFIPSEGYVKGNISIISMRANSLKSDGTVEEIQKLVDWMVKKQKEHKI